MNAVDRRKEVRVDVCEPVKFRPMADSVPPEHLGQTENMCQRGVCVATDWALKLGAQVELFLQIPRRLTEGDPVDVRCIARVVHVDGNPAGGRFRAGMSIERYERLKASARASELTTPAL